MAHFVLAHLGECRLRLIVLAQTFPETCPVINEGRLLREAALVAADIGVTAAAIAVVVVRLGRHCWGWRGFRHSSEVKARNIRSRHGDVSLVQTSTADVNVGISTSAVGVVGDSEGVRVDLTAGDEGMIGVLEHMLVGIASLTGLHFIYKLQPS